MCFAMTAPQSISPVTIALLPCPFCMRTLEHDTDISLTFHPKIPYEEYCPLKSFSFASDRSDIIGAWNTRASLQPATPTAWKCLAVSKAACAWPDCGCDPEATKVIAALVDAGWGPGQATTDTCPYKGPFGCKCEPGECKYKATASDAVAGAAGEKAARDYEHGYNDGVEWATVQGEAAKAQEPCSDLSEFIGRQWWAGATCPSLAAAILEHFDVRPRGVAQPTALPNGWKLVPERPTHRQMDAGLYQSSADSTFQDVYSIYADMIDAAPSITDHPSDTAPVAAPTLTLSSTEGNSHG
jgi:hypothetical protein